MGINFSALLGGPSQSLARRADVQLTERLRQEAEQRQYARQDQVYERNRSDSLNLALAQLGLAPQGATDPVYGQIAGITNERRERTESLEDLKMELEKQRLAFTKEYQDALIAGQEAQAESMRKAWERQEKLLQGQIDLHASQAELYRAQARDLDNPDLDYRYIGGYRIPKDGGPAEPVMVVVDGKTRPLPEVLAEERRNPDADELSIANRINLHTQKVEVVKSEKRREFMSQWLRTERKKGRRVNDNDAAQAWYEHLQDPQVLARIETLAWDKVGQAEQVAMGLSSFFAGIPVPKADQDALAAAADDAGVEPPVQDSYGRKYKLNPER